MRAEDLLPRLQGVRQTGPNAWMACCPAHDDERQSLAVSNGSESVLLHVTPDATRTRSSRRSACRGQIYASTTETAADSRSRRSTGTSTRLQPAPRPAAAPGDGTVLLLPSLPATATACATMPSFGLVA